MERKSALRKRKRMTFDKFWDKFKPVKNHLVADAPFEGCFFETYKQEVTYVEKMRKEHPNKVWTILTGVGKHDVIIAGYHFVNRLGYLITEIEFNQEEMGGCDVNIK